MYGSDISSLSMVRRLKYMSKNISTRVNATSEIQEDKKLYKTVQ